MKRFSICGVDLGIWYISLEQRRLFVRGKYFFCAGDVESNPGPFWKKGDDPIESLQNVIEDQADELKDLKDTIDDQNDTIDDLKMKLEDLSDKFTELSEDENKVKESNLLHGQMIESLKRDNDKIFQKLSDNDSKFDKEIIHQKVLYYDPDLMIILDLHIACVQETLEDAVSDLMKDLAKLRVDQADTRQRGEQAQEEVGTICISIKVINER